MWKTWAPAVALAAIAAAGQVNAQSAAPAATAPAAAPASAAKKELVAKVLQLQRPGVEAMARQLAEQPAMQLMQQAGQALQRVPEDKRQALARDIEADVRQYVEDAGPLVRDNAVRLQPEAIGPLLEERFTEEELREVIKVLESPANRKFQQMGADMQRALGEKLIAATREQVEAKVRALDQSVAKRLNAAIPQQPSAGGAKPAAGAASGAKPPAKK